MTKLNDLSGKQFTNLTVLSRAPNHGPRKKAAWNCVCSCGNMVVVIGESLSSGNSRSCGCLQKLKASKRLRKHGLSNARVYNIWNGIITRCLNKNHHSYANYGSRGISVCERWKTFQNFYADMGECPDGYSIDRIDNLIGYEPSNCKWVDQKTQHRNQRSNVLITFNGETLCQEDWAIRTGMKRETIARRINLGWPIEKILTAPVRRNRRE